MGNKGFIYSKALYYNIAMIVFVACFLFAGCRNMGDSNDLQDIFHNPPESAKPWVFWYWMNASISEEAITADLEAMKEAGIGGAYLMTIRGAENPPLFDPPAVQLSPLWWEMVLHALNEADRLNLKIAMHAGDGFALAGGPWITPELSMQKIVWTQSFIEEGRKLDITLEQPETNEGYYRDIALFAYPAIEGTTDNTYYTKPAVTSSLPGINPVYLVERDNMTVFRSEEPCWIQYEFKEPFACRTIIIRTAENNYQANRLIIQGSDDGIRFTTICRLEPPRHGWQDEGDVTHVIKPVKFRFYRFVYDKSGSEPGAEDLDAAKWSPSLKITGIVLSSAPKIHQYEGKTGAVWRISRRTQTSEVAESLCVQPEHMVDLSNQMDEDGHLTWDAPDGQWNILRIGHTSTGKTNYTGGGGLGLECDKFNPEAVKLQFDNWFGAACEKAGPELVKRVLKVFHVDSWECGSQNWSPVFRDEFRKRRGYDLYNFLPVMAGIPVQSTKISERFLSDVRQTIAELVVDNFYQTLAVSLQHYGCSFSAECVAPTMTSDGMLHYKTVDLPMGEFWLGSPTHDKPNDMMDAISGAHVYGKQIIQAEAFTELRLGWNEYPGMIKSLGDMNLALGANRFVFHVFTHNPWMDRRPGMTLSRIGLYFQRDQAWWEQGRAWIEYIQRCQALLQRGVHVADIAVFTGEEIPRRAILPDRLVTALPGIFGDDMLASEEKRLANTGIPLRERPDGVIHTANMADPENWIDPLKGYAYDSFNPDVLLNLATVKDGRIILPGGANYGLLVIPGSRRMSPDGNIMSAEIAQRVLELVEDGATVLFVEKPEITPGLYQHEEHDRQLGDILTALFGIESTSVSPQEKEGIIYSRVGKGRIMTGPYDHPSFGLLGIEPDFQAWERSGSRAEGIAWTHRKDGQTDIYFISNQEENNREVEISLRVTGKLPELFDPVTGEIRDASEWKTLNNRTIMPVRLAPNGSLFVVLAEKTTKKGMDNGSNWNEYENIMMPDGPWTIIFNPDFGGPDSAVKINRLKSWHLFDDPAIRYYSGIAVYQNSFRWASGDDSSARYFINLGEVANIAEVFVNGRSCGVAWTPPFHVEITENLKEGENRFVIEVSNTWANRLIGDHSLPPEKRITWTTAPWNLEGKPLLESGLLGPVSIMCRNKVE
jgi:hypothetical protein